MAAFCLGSVSRSGCETVHSFPHRHPPSTWLPTKPRTTVRKAAPETSRRTRWIPLAVARCSHPHRSGTLGIGFLWEHVAGPVYAGQEGLRVEGPSAHRAGPCCQQPTSLRGRAAELTPVGILLGLPMSHLVRIFRPYTTKGYTCRKSKQTIV